MEEIPEEFWQGVEQFNQQQFYACHDTLEALWMNAMQSEKNFYQGILQIAVALYHLGNQNWRGAVILMGEGMNRLRNYQPTYADVDVESFLAETALLFKQLQETGPDQVATVMEQLGYGSLPHQEPLQKESSQNWERALSCSSLRLPILQRVA